MVSVLHEFRGNIFEQFLFDLEHVLARRQAGAVTDTEDMCIHGNGRMAEGGVQYHIGGLTPDTGQGLKCLARRWDFPFVFVQQDLTGLDNVFGLGVEQANGLDVLAQTTLLEREHFLGSARNFEQFPCRKIHTFVCRLSGEDDGDE